MFEEEKKMEKEKEREETQPASFLSTRFISSLKESILIYILRVRGSHASLPAEPAFPCGDDSQSVSQSLADLDW